MNGNEPIDRCSMAQRAEILGGRHDDVRYRRAMATFGDGVNQADYIGEIRHRRASGRPEWKASDEPIRLLDFVSVNS